jgi:hypothetical protein
MKNQTARFSAGNDTLTISLRRNRESLKTQVRHRPADDKPKVGCKNYFDFTEEAKAQESFETLVKDALAKGWTAHAKRERTPAFTAIPQAPGHAVRDGRESVMTAKRK